MHCSTERGVYSLKMTVIYCGLKTRRIIPLMHTHTLHTQRSPVAIDHVDADEWIKNTTIAVWGCTPWKCLVDVCPLTFYPDSRSTPPSETSWGTCAPRPSSPVVCRWALWCYRRMFPGCRWSLAAPPPRPSASSCLTQLLAAAAAAAAAASAAFIMAVCPYRRFKGSSAELTDNNITAVQCMAT